VTRASRYRSRGYFTPFAMVTVFAIATVAAGVVVAAGQYRKAAGRAERELLDRVSLESAVTAQADALLTGGPKPLAAHDGLTFAINRRTVSVEVSAPQGKFDLNGDTPEAIGQGLAVYGIRPALSERLTGALTAGRATAGQTPIAYESLRDVAAALDLSASDEDCLRRWVTVGRWPGAMDDSGIGRAGDGAPERAIGPGDQSDLRASLVDRRGDSRALWARLRFTGDAAQPWKAHDWRFLQPGGGAAACL
jgi:hypothetical protein